MSDNMYWFLKMLRGKINYCELGKQMVSFNHFGEECIVYCPFTDEYEITVDLVRKVSRLGVNVLIYPTAWCRATREAIGHGQNIGVEVIPLKEFMKKYVS